MPVQDFDTLFEAGSFSPKKFSALYQSLSPSTNDHPEFSLQGEQSGIREDEDLLLPDLFGPDGDNRTSITLMNKYTLTNIISVTEKSESREDLSSPANLDTTPVKPRSIPYRSYLQRFTLSRGKMTSLSYGYSLPVLNIFVPCEVSVFFNN